METEALKEACAHLPDGASWGDHVTPEMVLAIAEAARGYERERCSPLMQAVEWLLDDGHMNTEHLARLRAAFERA